MNEVNSKDKFNRVGLGLTCVKKILDTLNGSTLVENKTTDDFTRGSIFKV